MAMATDAGIDLPFRDRIDAGEALATRLSRYAGRPPIRV